MARPKMYEWTVRIRVTGTWVADGFDLTADRMQAMVLSDLRYAHDHEIECEVVKAPAAADIRREQGYRDASDAAPVRT